MSTEFYYHGTKERNKQNIIDSRKLVQSKKEYKQSEDGFVYICCDRDFAQTISYAADSQEYSYTFVKIEVVINSMLHRSFQVEEKESIIGTLISLKHRGEIDLSSECVRSAKIVTLKKGDQEYDDFIGFITAYPPEYDKAKLLIDSLIWSDI